MTPPTSAQRHKAFNSVLIAIVGVLSVIVSISVLVSQAVVADFTGGGTLTNKASSIRHQQEQANTGLGWYTSITECVDDRPQECAARQIGTDHDNSSSNNNKACATIEALKRCPASCKLCNNVRGNYISSPFGVDQLLVVAGEQPHAKSLTMARIEATRDYMLETVYVQDAYQQVRSECLNRHEHCSFWAAVQGLCDTNPAMVTDCAPACLTCDMLDIKARCPFDPTTAAPSAWQPGDLNRMFERIVTDPAYNVSVHSRPATSFHTDDQGPFFNGPWVVTLDNFLSPAECDRLIALGHVQGFERSMGVDMDQRRFDGTMIPTTVKKRTSTTAWCLKECSADPVVAKIRQRMVDLTGIPDDNAEPPQLLRYEAGQFYKEHTDYIASQRDKAPGVRILTVFLYLTHVEAGGGTNFPLLNNLTVHPKQGRIVVWPSVLDERPNDLDQRTRHQALAVQAGVKYSVNGWFHQRDIKGPMKMNCHR
jgi:prolyl 4-hydroxylase